MSSLKQRYAIAINASSLKHDPDSTYSNVDVLGAYGLAGKYHPLGVALQRLFVGGKTTECLTVMTSMVLDRSYKVKERMNEGQALDLSKRVLAWYRYGTCTECGGTGKEVIFEPKPHLSDEDCPTCKGSGKRPFEPSFTNDIRDIALWLKGEVERNQAVAGRAAMTLIAPMLDL